MDPISAAVARFQADLRRFRANPKAQLLRVLVGAADLDALQAAIRLAEWAPSNRSPYLTFSAAWPRGEAPFAAMSASLRLQYDTLRTQGDLGPLPEFGDLHDERGPSAVFARETHRFIECTHGRLDAPLLCWTPALVQDAAAYAHVMRGMIDYLTPMGSRILAVDEPEGRWLRDAAEERGDGVVTISFAVDQAAAKEHFRRLMLVAPAKGRARGTPPGSAAPDVEPPPRPGPRPPTEEQVRAAVAEAGLPPILTASEGEELRRLIFGAAAAAGEGREAEALGQQYAAYELCHTAGVRLEQSLMALVLASYLLQFRREEEAERWYGEAASRAEAVEAWPQVAQARLALGYLLLRQKRPLDAAASYEAGAAAAAKGGATLLFLETHRMAGRCHLQAQREPEAIRCWTAAVERGCGTPLGELRASSFPEIVDELRAALTRQGMRAERERVEELVAPVAAELGA
jgi:hypothetical protein